VRKYAELIKMENYGFEHIDNIDKYLSSIEKYRPLNAKDEQEIGRKIIEGDKTELDKLVRANLKFVVTIAKQYRGKGVPFDELISEGNMGLITAAMKFDPSKGCKFITYAVYWVKSYINKRIANVTSENAAMNSIYDKIKATSNICENEEEILQNVSASTAVEDITKCLNEREYEMVSMYFGLNGKQESSYKEIGKHFHVTSECARQTVNQSLSKMKQNAVCSEHFNEYLNIAKRTNYN
jgi:RNA polymerase primary sigma factor